MSTEGYPSDWDSRREKVYNRDGYTCQNCGRSGGHNGSVELHAHHVVPKAKDGTHNTTNLITICKDCHHAVHGNKAAPTEQISVNSPSNKIDSLDDLLSLTSDVFEEMDPISGLCNVVKSGTKYSEYDLAGEEGKRWVDLAKDSREKVTVWKFRLEHMDIDDKRIKENSGGNSPINTISDYLLDIIDELIITTNLAQEYIETLSVIECIKCGNLENHTDSFCGECGEEIPDVWYCSSCGESIESSTQNFCKSCGDKTSTFPKAQKSELITLHEDIEESAKKYKDGGVLMDKAGKIAHTIQTNF